MRRGDHLPVQTVRYVDGSVDKYLQYGEGPDLLFFYGLLQGPQSVRHLVCQLGNHFRVTILLLPGAEQSTLLKPFSIASLKGRLHRFLKELGISQAVVGSNSLGALPAAIAADCLKGGKPLFFFSYEPVTSFSHTRIGWVLLYRISWLCRKLRLGFVSGAVIWLVRIFCAGVLRLGWAKALMGVRIAVFEGMGDLIADQSSQFWFTGAANNTSTLIVYGQKQTKWLLNYKQITAYWQFLRARKSSLVGSDHILRKESQILLAQRVIAFAKHEGVIP